MLRPAPLVPSNELIALALVGTLGDERPGGRPEGRVGDEREHQLGEPEVGVDEHVLELEQRLLVADIVEPTSGMPEQLHTKPRLEAANVATDCRMADIELFTGFGKAL